MNLITQLNETLLNERYLTIVAAIRQRLPDFDVDTSSLPPPVAGSMRRGLKKNLQRLEELKALTDAERAQIEADLEREG